MTDYTPSFTANQVLNATGGILLFGTETDLFFGITTDSRKVMKGNLFIALEGEKFDGHDFIELAVKQGAAGVLVH
ncbi:MAG: Mur ligase domain-containing protein, partial [Smithella sp.]